MAKKSNEVTEEESHHRGCLQEMCEFNQNGGCKNCEKCNAEPKIINTHCSKCLSCENGEGAIRWSDPKTDAHLEKMAQIKMAQNLLNEAERQKELDKQIIVQIK
jgi:hypothetical protein